MTHSLPSPVLLVKLVLLSVQLLGRLCVDVQVLCLISRAWQAPRRITDSQLRRVEPASASGLYQVMQFCCTGSADGSKVHLRLLGCSAFVAAWLLLSFTWLRYVCLGGSHPFQVQALQPCTGQSNRTSFVNSSMVGYQCYGPSGERMHSL